jgi:hypothetical protein
MLHTIHFKREGRQETILADKMPVGYLIQEYGFVCVNITGTTSRGFVTKADAVLWVLKNIDKLYSSVVEWKFRHFEAEKAERYANVAA